MQVASTWATSGPRTRRSGSSASSRTTTSTPAVRAAAAFSRPRPAHLRREAPPGRAGGRGAGPRRALPHHGRESADQGDQAPLRAGVMTDRFIVCHTPTGTPPSARRCSPGRPRRSTARTSSARSGGPSCAGGSTMPGLHPPRHLPDQAAPAPRSSCDRTSGRGLSPPLELSAPHGARGFGSTAGSTRKGNRGPHSHGHCGGSPGPPGLKITAPTRLLFGPRPHDLQRDQLVASRSVESLQAERDCTRWAEVSDALGPGSSFAVTRRLRRRPGRSRAIGRGLADLG